MHISAYIYILYIDTYIYIYVCVCVLCVIISIICSILFITRLPPPSFTSKSAKCFHIFPIQPPGNTWVSLAEHHALLRVLEASKLVMVSNGTQDTWNMEHLQLHKCLITKLAMENTQSSNRKYNFERSIGFFHCHFSLPEL